MYVDVLENAKFKVSEWSCKGIKMPWSFRPVLQIFIASTPHIGLIVANIVYTVVGAMLFMYIESQNEINVNMGERDQLQQLYDSAANSTYGACFASKVMIPRVAEKIFRKRLLRRLVAISKFHERTPHVLSPFLNSAAAFTSSWNIAKSIIYSLSLTTATGYSDLAPLTGFGKALSVVYGLFGIPLMFATAANVGKLLSEALTTSWVRFMISRTRDRRPSEKSWRRRRHLVARSRLKKPKRSSLSRLPGFEAGKRLLERSTLRRRQSYRYHNMPVEVPGWMICLMPLVYIFFAGGVFAYFRGWNYIASVHFAFEAMTSITVGITPIDSISYLLWLVLFCMCGLYVITTCLDLAKVKLTNLFIRLHYFGRKLGKRLGEKHESLDPEVLMLAQAIREMREQGFDSMDISLLLQYWMRKKQQEEELRRLMEGAFKPAELVIIPFVDKKNSFRSCDGLTRSPSLATLEDIEYAF